MNIQDNFLRYAMLHYDNPGAATAEEFNEDLMKFTYIKRMLCKDFNKQLMLNHIITTLNVFNQYATVVMLFYKIDKKNWSTIKTYLEFLSIMPNEVPELGILSKEIEVDEKLMGVLREL